MTSRNFFSKTFSTWPAVQDEGTQRAQWTSDDFGTIWLAYKTFKASVKVSELLTKIYVIKSTFHQIQWHQVPS